jgi:quaternary ammonium compound-resistance protein SugE
MTPWTALLLAGACEVIATTIFRYIEGFTRPVPTGALLVMGAISLYLLNRSLAGIPLGTAYAVWTGIGAAGTALVGIAFYGEGLNATRLLCLTMLIGGIVGLKLFD